MFTGIVQAVGKVEAMTRRGADAHLRIATDKLDLAGVKSGDSVAVNGVCLTAVELYRGGFAADVSAETLRCTTFAALRAGDAVNLEKSLTLAAPLGGHLVSGHVDGTGAVQSRGAAGQSVRYVIAVAPGLAKFIAAKGSVCVDGVSLTVNDVQGNDFEVNIVPHTLRETTLGALAAGAQVNVEVDLMARYAERLLAADRAARGGLGRALLARSGFAHD